MAQVINISNWKGLHVQANSFALVPDGALEDAENLVITRDGILQKRRGHFSFLSNLTSPLALTEYNGLLILAHNTSKLSKISAEGTVTDVGTGLSYGTYIRFAEAGGKLFTSTATGVKALDSLTSTVRNAGLPAALDLDVSISGKVGPIPPGSKTGYRILFGFDGENGERLLSAPSNYTSVTNALVSCSATNASAVVDITHNSHGYSTSVVIEVSEVKDSVGATITNVDGTYTATVVDPNTLRFTAVGTPSGTVATLKYGVFKQGDLSFTVPAGLTTSHFYQVYRTDSSATENTSESEDDLKLVIESNLSAGQISAGVATATDLVDPLFMGAYCYTNTNTGQGISNSNFEPPLCEDIALFKNTLFFGATTLKHQLPMLIISAAALLVDDTVTVGGQTYTAKSVENIASKHFLKISSGSVAYDHDQVARSLCRVVNRTAASTVVAFYTSGPLDVPGQIVFQAKDYATSFTFACSRAGVWNPEATTAQDSAAASDAHVLRFSKFEQPEHVPAWAYLPIGNKGEAILRLVALKDSLIVIKQNSIWRVNGDAGNFVATLLDNTLSCRAPNSVVSLNNAVWLVTNQGITVVTDSGAQVISRQIEPLLTSVLGQQAFYDYTSAIAYESDRAYVLSTIEFQDSTEADITYYYNTVTQSFTSWTKTFSTGIVAKSDDKLYYLKDTSLLKERKNMNKVDYCDEGFSCTVDTVSVDKKSFSIITVGDPPAVGDIIVYSNTIFRIIGADYSGLLPILYFDFPVTFSDGDTVFHYVAIVSKFKTAPISLGSTGILKHFSELSMHIRNDALSSAVIRFSTDSVESSADLQFSTTNAAIGWGISYWGQRAWGDPNGIDTNLRTGIAQIFRTYIPQDCQRATFLQIEMQHQSAGEAIDLQMLSLSARPIRTRV